jgi:long-subunit fatty acid transport protein
MKKIIGIFAFVAITCSANAGGLKENTNQSAMWSRTGNRNASTSPDATFYNPAGTALLNDGLHLSLSNQSIFQTRTTKDNGITAIHTAMGAPEEFEGSVNAPFFPNFYIVYKTGQLAISGGFVPIGGGGGAEFSKGLPSYWAKAANQTFTLAGYGLDQTNVAVNFDASSIYLGGQLNAAYAINPMISVSIGGLYYVGTDKGTGKFNQSVAVTGAPTLTGNIISELDYKETGSAFGVVLGTNAKINKELNIGLRFQWNSDLKMKRTLNKAITDASSLQTPLTAAMGAGTADMIISGLTAQGAADIAAIKPDKATVYNTLPMLVALGVSYNLTPELRVEPNINYYLNKSVKWKEVDKDGNTTNTATSFKNGYDLGFTVEYKIIPQLVASLGYFHTENGSIYSESIWLLQEPNKSQGVTDQSEGLDSNTILGGVTYKAMPNLDITLAGNYTKYIKAEIASYLDPTKKIDVNKNNWSVAIGVDYALSL